MKTPFPIGEHRGWEDDYGATCYDNIQILVAQTKEMWLGTFANLNWPVWVEYDDEQKWDCGPVVTVGVFMPRHGRCWQHIAPATPEEAQKTREMVMRVWANRADAGFRRYTSAAHEISTPDQMVKGFDKLLADVRAEDSS